MNRNTLRKETSISRSVGGSCVLDMRQCMLFACLIVCSPKQNEMRSVLYMGATAMRLLNGTRDCTVVRIKRTPAPIQEFHLKTYLCSYRSPLFIITIHDKLSNALGHKAQLFIWNWQKRFKAPWVLTQSHHRSIMFRRMHNMPNIISDSNRSLYTRTSAFEVST